MPCHLSCTVGFGGLYVPSSSFRCSLSWSSRVRSSSWLPAQDRLSVLMLCRKPYMKGMQPLGCGQCVPCRINRRRVWTARLMYEAASSSEACFVTLTYAPEHYPPDGNLQPGDLRDWLKRFRKRLWNDYGLRVRFFAVGEYGDKSWRAHYHALLFGVGPWCTSLVRETWGKGHVMVGTVGPESAQYVAGYCLKKLTKDGVPGLGGRTPEFARMSLKPGIGAGIVPAIVKAITDMPGSMMVAALGDVPTQFRTNGKQWPLGRYLARKVREEYAGCGDTPDKAKAFRQAELFALLESKGGNVAVYKASQPFVDWDRSDAVVSRYARAARLGKGSL